MFLIAKTIFKEFLNLLLIYPNSIPALVSLLKLDHSIDNQQHTRQHWKKKKRKIKNTIILIIPVSFIPYNLLLLNIASYFHAMVYTIDIRFSKQNNYLVTVDMHLSLILSNWKINMVNLSHIRVI